MKALFLLTLAVSVIAQPNLSHAVNSTKTVFAIAKLQPGTEAAFQAEVSKILQPTRHEPGNISYFYYQSDTNPNEFVFAEQWKSQADIDVHLKSAHMKAFFSAVQTFFQQGYPEISTYSKRN